MHALVEQFGPVDAARLITLIQRDPFDYTEWRKNLWNDLSVEKISRRAMEHRRKRDETNSPS